MVHRIQTGTRPATLYPIENENARAQTRYVSQTMPINCFPAPGSAQWM